MAGKTGSGGSPKKGLSPNAKANAYIKTLPKAQQERARAYIASNVRTAARQGAVNPKRAGAKAANQMAKSVIGADAFKARVQKGRGK